MFCPQKISEKWKIKVYEVGSVPPCCHLLTLCAAVRCFWLCSAPCYEVCQWPHYARAFGLGRAPGYPPAGNCVPLSCLSGLGLFWFLIFLAVAYFFFWFLISSWCRLCWQLLTAEKIKISKQTKKGPPQTKGLKIQNKTHMARNGEDPIVLEAHGIYFSL